MQLDDSQVTTEEVKGWKGVHLLHFHASSCSQKVRILLEEKGIDWVSHPIDLMREEHTHPWYLGINPRGVVPVLVHDGVVHIESNDILEYIDRALPSAQAPFFPQNDEERRLVRQSLDEEDALHMDLRNLTMGFLAPSRLVRKSPATLKRYEDAGVPDAKRDKEIAWWRDFAERGIPNEVARASGEAFSKAFSVLESRLDGRRWLIGDRLSVLELAWFISIHRVVTAGYPIERHPRLEAHYQMLLGRPAFANQVRPRGIGSVVFPAIGLYRRLTGTDLRHVMA